MKPFYVIRMLVFITCCCNATAKAADYGYETGEMVLTNCHLIYSKGIIQGKATEGYVIDFPKSSRPINCPPFRWHHEFIMPLASVNEYRLQFREKGWFGSQRDLLFKIGETVTLRLETDERLLSASGPIDIEARITDISSNGAIAVERLTEGSVAEVTFWQWVGSNYIDLRHDALKPERDKRSR